MIGQLFLGFFQHRIYKQTQAPTKLTPIHVWLGRIVIPAGIINGFLGFPLALNSKYNWALFALCLLIIIVIAPFAFWKWKRDNKKNNFGATPLNSDGPPGYQSEPWMAGESSSNINMDQMSYPHQGYPMQYDSPVQNRQFV